MDESGFVAQSKARLHDILKKLKWTEENVFKTFNTNSEAAQLEERTEDELDMLKEPLFPKSCAQKNYVLLEQRDLQILLKDASISVMPTKFSDLQVGFSREQKLKLYEYVIDKTEKFSEPEKSIPFLNNSQQSFAKILALKKLEKKKHRKYRTTKPTYIEEVRGLVELQMQALEQFLGRQDHEEGKNKSHHYKHQRKDTEKISHKRTDGQRNKIEMRVSRKRSRSHSNVPDDRRHDKHTSSREPNSHRYREPNSHVQRRRSRSHHRGHREKHKKRSRSRSEHHKRRSRNTSSDYRTPEYQSHRKSRSRSRNRNRKHRSRSNHRGYKKKH